MPATRIKLKLGSPEGLHHDRALRAWRWPRPWSSKRQPGWSGLELQVDANGGWDLEDARACCLCWQDLGVVLVEQPLAAAAGPRGRHGRFRGPGPGLPDSPGGR
jgi:L-alanine-DL-glutamate epimerase-like enolase superfamily enzyme